MDIHNVEICGQHSRNTTTRNGWRPTRIIPIQFIFRYGGSSEHTFILNIYVDDLTLAGGNKDVQMQFWKDVKFRAKTDPEQYIEVKILGRVHSIQRSPKQVFMTNDRRSYSRGITSFYCEIAGMRQLAHEGEMQAFAARILMRCLWLSHLARPDIGFAVQQLASGIARWPKWEDRQILRLVSYLSATCVYVMRAAVEPDQAGTLLVYTNSDFASCPYTSKSTSGVVYVLQTGSSCARYSGPRRNKFRPRGVPQKLSS